MTSTCTQPLSAEDLIDYSLGELDPAAESALEEHLFTCEACTRTLQDLVQLGAAIVRAATTGGVAAPASDALVRHALARGAQVREYRLAPGDTVACTAGPNDTFVAVRLRGAPAGLVGVGIEVGFEDLATGQRATRRVEDVPVDVVAGEIVLLFSGDTVRSYPRSRWTMHADGTTSGGDIHLGPYTLDHTPWEELTPAGPTVCG